MSTAEDRRNRPEFSSDAYPAKSSREPANDPLAELARLIGQSDPFADLKAQGARTPTSGLRASDRPAPQWLARPAPPAGQDQYDDPHADGHDGYAAQGYAQDGYADHGYASDQHGTHHDDGAYAQPAYGSARQPVGEAYDANSGHQYRVALPPAEDYDEDSYYAEDGHMPPHEEGAAPPRKRGGLITVAAVLGLAVIGTAGALGYRAFTSGGLSSGAPPIIKADTSPAKTVPPAAAANTDAQGKPFQDRVAALATPERVVPREEQPVALPVATTPAAAAPAPALPTPAAAAPNPNEPKRVRTMTIRPDGAADAAPVQPPPPSAGGTRSIAPPARQSAAPMDINPAPEQPAARAKVAVRTPPAQAAGGGYVVQVSAQKTEAEAQSSYRALQQKYPSVLGQREANIRRVDLGDKGGVYYRVQIGSFATSEQASAFCGSYRDAGGQCIVAKN